MNQSQFEALARSGIVRRYEEAFRIATGLAMKLQQVSDTDEVSPTGTHVNPFCALMSCRPLVKEACRQTFSKIRDESCRTRSPARACCFAGFAHVAVPVISGGDHIATLYGGQLRVEGHGNPEFPDVERELVRLGLADRLAELKHAWRDSPVVSERQFQAAIHLLETFAERISKYSAIRVLEAVEGEPAAITRARRFIRERFAEPVSMPEAARHLQMSPTSFSKMFKKALGITFTQYITRFRVEHSKTRLVNPSESIRQIAFQSGFDSISQFNRSFRQCTGMSPTGYRAWLEGAETASTKGRASDTASCAP